MNREERKEILNAMGIETNNYMAFDLPKGATIIIATPYDTDNETNNLLERVNNVGFIREDPYFRRWVMAQTFEILNSKKQMSAYILNNKGGYMYQFNQIIDELKAIAKITDKETKDIRSMFFTKDVVTSLCEDYMNHIKKYINLLSSQRKNGKSCKLINKKWIDVNCINSKIYAPLDKCIDNIKATDDYNELAKYMSMFVDKMVKIDMWNFKLCDRWLSAYKGAGAYYTLMGLIKFHNCRVYDNGDALNVIESINKVDEKVKECIKEGGESGPSWYILYGMLKEVIKDNNFDFDARMKEIYN